MTTAEIEAQQPEEPETNQRSFQVVDELEGSGITTLDIKKLKEGYYHTIEQIAQASKRQLTQVKGISEAKAERLLEISRSMVGNMGFTTAAAVRETRDSLVTITTGSRNLDGLLRGGIETGSLTELFGEFATGKSQLCHTLAVTCQLRLDMGGAEGKCLYIDTENTFRPERIAEICQRYGLNESETLNNIAYARAFNVEHQYELLNAASEMMVKTRFALVIIDSVMNLFRAEFAGRGELSNRQTQLNQFLHRLQQLANTYGVAVVYTNQVTAQVDGMASFIPDPKKPIGGNIMAHASTTRIGLRKGKKEQRIASIYDSPLVANAMTKIGIYSHGIDDPAEDDAGQDSD